MDYSYRSDPDVPPFDDPMPIAVMDGDCALCSFGAQLIDRFDHRRQIRICPIETKLGAALLSHYGYSVSDPSSWLFIADGKCWTSFEAWIVAGRTCGGIGRLLEIFWILPRSVRHWIYLRVAQNRVKWFGRQRMCEIAKPSLKARLIGDE